MSSGSSEDIGEGILVKPQEICMPYLFKDFFFFPRDNSLAHFASTSFITQTSWFKANVRGTLSINIMVEHHQAYSGGLSVT